MLGAWLNDENTISSIVIENKVKCFITTAIHVNISHSQQRLLDLILNDILDAATMRLKPVTPVSRVDGSSKLVVGE